MPASLTRPRPLVIILVAFALIALAAWAAQAKLGDETGEGTAVAEPLPQRLAEANPTAPIPPSQIHPAYSDTPPPKRLPDGSLPPASAGTNGSYDPPSPEERERIAARTNPDDGPFADERTAIQLGGTAIPPANAPELIKQVISAANLIVGQPYKWGGGHASWRSAGYDCSGAVSFALAGAGLIQSPMTSGQLASWGVPGRGKWLTIYAKGSHVYAVVAGLRWDTVGNARGTGPRWHPFDAYPEGYSARHLPGY